MKIFNKVHGINDIVYPPNENIIKTLDNMLKVQILPTSWANILSKAQNQQREGITKTYEMYFWKPNLSKFISLSMICADLPVNNLYKIEDKCLETIRSLI